jgi:hypothetical protein
VLEQVEDDGSASSSGIWKATSTGAPEIGGDAALADALGDRAALGLQLAVV